MLSKILSFVFFLSILSSTLTLKSQPRLEAEINQIVTILVKQINNHKSIRTVAIADFTDLAYQPNLLGKQLSEEFLSAFVGAQDKNFRMISRSMFEALLAEQSLDKQGRITPDNLPQYGVLQGIDMVLGATLTPKTNTVRINFRGIEVDSGNLVAAYSGNITLTPSFESLINQKPRVTKNVITGKKEQNQATDPFPEHQATQSLQSQKRGGLLIEAEGCKYVNDEVVCHFALSSLGGDETVSVYCFSSSAAFSKSSDLLQRPSQLQIGEQKGNRRITKTLLADDEVALLVYLTPNATNLQSVANLNIKCHTNSEGIFDLIFENIPILK